MTPLHPDGAKSEVSDDSLPAATTTTAPCAIASSIASWTAFGQRAEAAEAHVDHLRRIRDWEARRRSARRTPTACLRRHPRRCRRIRRARGPARSRANRSMPDMPIAIVGVGRHDPRDESAVPGARARREPSAGAVVAPVAFVARIGVAPVAVARERGVGDEVVAGKDAVRRDRCAAGCRCRSARSSCWRAAFAAGGPRPLPR